MLRSRSLPDAQDLCVVFYLPLAGKPEPWVSTSHAMLCSRSLLDAQDLCVVFYLPLAGKPEPWVSTAYRVFGMLLNLHTFMLRSLHVP
jgi:hypothetical protein